MTSPLLLHGPGAMGSAHEEAARIGRQAAPPVGEGGLKADDARGAARILRSAPLGDAQTVLIIGPVDNVRAEASDVLLKPLEEYQEGRTLPILWAQDAGAVPGTICSRCELRWCPTGPVPEETLRKPAQKLIEAWQAKELSTIIETVTDHEDDRELLLAAGALVISEMEKKPLKLWLQLRQAMEVSNPTFVEVLVAWLP